MSKHFLSTCFIPHTTWLTRLLFAIRVLAVTLSDPTSRLGLD
jgi:hypothetical protein